MFTIYDLKITKIDKSICLSRRELINSLSFYYTDEECIESLKFILKRSIYSYNNDGIIIKGNKKFYKDTKKDNYTKLYYKLKVYNKKTNKLLLTIVFYNIENVNHN